jgi:undecaprenyl-diphosphatase
MDQAVLEYFQSVVTDSWLTQVMKVFTTLGDAGLVWIVLAFVFLFFPKTRQMGVVVALALLVMVFTNNVILKSLFARERPFNTYSDIFLFIPPPTSLSFPSGHTSASFAFVTAVFPYRKWWAVAFLPLAAVISFSRIYLSVHYFTDVLGGIAFGIGYGVIGILLGSLLWKRFGPKLMRIGVKEKVS